MRPTRILLIFSLTLMLQPFGSPAQTQAELHDVLVVKHTTDFEVTGDGASEAWSRASWRLLENRAGSSAETSRVKMLYSDSGLYFLFSFDDKKITATLTQDFENLFKEDVAEIFLWPDESEPIYLEYEISPLNYELVILVPNLNGKLFGWQPWHYEGDRKTHHATHIVKDSNDQITQWTAEVFIPYALLQPLGNVPPKKGSQWRANLYRIDYDHDVSYWSAFPFKNNFHDFEMFGAIKFE